MESPLRNIAAKDLKIIETIRYEPENGFARLGLHIDRAERTATLLGIEFDRAACLMTLGSSVDTIPSRCRLTIDMRGEVGVTVSELNTNAPVWNLRLAETTLEADDPWLQVKTTERKLYDETRSNHMNGADEVIFLNRNGHVCEGTITNVFIDNGAGLLTPALECGLLPGILRQELLEAGKATEALITLNDLKNAKKIFVGNSLRGLIPAILK